jgi:Domain of unknown function (DUF4430)
VIRRALSALFTLVLLAGCVGAAGEEQGTAQLWVTRDRGAKLLVEADVDAGQTLMRALAAEADVETRYGGRYVQAVNGIEGSLGDQRDWFWFVNGYEGDRSAASYKLRDGDVAWLDYRGWEREGEARVVVGAFPEPFLHGYEGKKRRAVVRYAPEVKYVFARQRAAEIQADPKSVKPLGTPVPAGANVLVLRSGARAVTAELLGQTAGDPVRFVMTGVPRKFERRYEVRP